MGADKTVKEIRLEEVANQLSTQKLFDRYKIVLFQRMQEGDTSLAGELQRMSRIERELNAGSEADARRDVLDGLQEVESGIPEHNKVKRPYTMSPAARAARRRNAQNSTGPVTPEGKARSAANGQNANWKHGQYSKSVVKKVMGVCTEDCDEHPCEAVTQGDTHPGELCLGRTRYLEKVKLLLEAAQTGDLKGVKELASVQLGNMQEIFEQMMLAVIHDGTMLKEDMFGRKGELLGHKFVNHPHLKPIAEFAKALGINMAEYRLTPRELQKSRDVEDAGKAMADMFVNAGKALAQANKAKDSNGAS